MLLHPMVWESKHHGYINAYEIGLMTIPQYGNHVLTTMLHIKKYMQVSLSEYTGYCPIITYHIYNMYEHFQAA
jgi:hypothetical protein